SELSFLNFIIDCLAFGIVYQPLLIFFVAFLFRKLKGNYAWTIVAVKPFNPLGKFLNIMIRCFGNEYSFLFLNDFPFPAINRIHAVYNINAGCQLFLNELASN